MKFLSEGIKRHMSHNTFIIWLLMVYFMIVGVWWNPICYDGRKVTTYTTHQWYVVLEVFCVVYVVNLQHNMLLLVYQHVLLEVSQQQHVVVDLPTCVVGGKPTTTCCCWYILQPTPPTPTHQGISWVFPFLMRGFLPKIILPYYWSRAACSLIQSTMADEGIKKWSTGLLKISNRPRSIII